MNKNIIEISWGSLWRILTMIILFIVLFLTKDIFVMFLLSLVLSSAFDAPVDFLEKKKIPRIISTLFLFLGTFAIIALVLYTLIPTSLLEAKEFLGQIKNYSIPLIGSFNSLEIANINQLLGNWADTLFSGSISFLQIAANIFGNIALLAILIVLAFYLTIDKKGVETFLQIILPTSHEKNVISIYTRVKNKMTSWFQGQLILMVLVGLSAFIGLWALNVKYSLMLGVLAGILEIVPIAGPIFSGIIAFLIASSDSLNLGFYTIALFTIIQQLEAHIFVPIVMKKTTGINPVIVVLSILIGSKLAGFVGILLAIPTVLVFQEILSDWEKRKSISNKQLE